MPAAHDSLLERITIDSDVRFGKPCIRGHRITVQEILEWLSSGASQQQILADYPRSEEHTSELQSLRHLVCRLLLEKKKTPAQATDAVFPTATAYTCPIVHRLG